MIRSKVASCDLRSAQPGCLEYRSRASITYSRLVLEYCISMRVLSSVSETALLKDVQKFPTNFVLAKTYLGLHKLDCVRELEKQNLNSESPGYRRLKFNFIVCCNSTRFRHFSLSTVFEEGA